MKRRQAFLLFAAACFIAGCRDSSTEPLRAEDRPLHGSAAIVARFAEPIDPSEPWTIGNEAFREHFERLGRLALDDAVVVGSITRMDVSHDGRLLVFDRSGGQVDLFGPDGTHLRRLSPEACDPAYPWQPMDAVFFDDGTILVVSNTARPGLRFDVDGLCFDRQEMGSFGAHFVDVDSDGNVYKFRLSRQGYGTTVYAEDGREERRIGEETDFRNYMSHLVSGGIVVVERRLYVALAFSPVIFAYDADGAKSTVGVAPPDFRPIREDLPDGLDTNGWRNAMRGPTEDGVSSTVDLMQLDRDRLVQFIRYGAENFQYSEKGMGLQVVSTAGPVLNRSPIRFVGYRSGFIGAADGVLYQVIQPEPSDDGEYGNPYLILYRFTG